MPKRQAMFDLERFVAECRSALRERSPELAVKETVARAMADPGEVERVLGIHAVRPHVGG